MSLRIAVIIGLVGTALAVVLQLGLLVGGEAYINFMYGGDISIGLSLIHI